MEEAQAYERLIADFGLTQEDVARRVGKNRATIANMLRLLRLPTEVQQWLRENRLTTGHAKALLSLSDLNAILDSARKDHPRKLLRSAGRDAGVALRAPMLPESETQSGGRNWSDPNVKAAIHALEQVLGTKVTVQENGGKGKIEIHFFSFEEMNRLYEGFCGRSFNDSRRWLSDREAST